jgi:hypothetical protein
MLAAQLALLFIHFVDDYAFQSIVRTELLLQDLPELGVPRSFERLPEDLVTEVEARLERRLRPHAESLGRSFGAYPMEPETTGKQVVSITMDPPRLPWKRLFEVAIEPHVELR